jgi:hypothetical protein
MKNNILVLFALISCNILQAQNQTTKKVFKDAETQVGLLLKESETNRSARFVFPRTVVRDSVKLVTSDDWTSGFFPGILWLLYEQTRNNKWKVKAEQYTALMVRELTNGNSHDVGFKVYNSYGNGYRLTGNNDYKAPLLEAARTLSKRFNPVVGSIRSWDFGNWQYPVIIDNMMNLELLFAATKISGDSSFYHIATAHANTTLKNHFRANYSSYHVVNYDTTTGKVMGKETHQGYAAESAWARGQAWALYGFTMCYRETKDTRYLDRAKGIAAFILNIVPCLQIEFLTGILMCLIRAVHQETLRQRLSWLLLYTS